MTGNAGNDLKSVGRRVAEGVVITVAGGLLLALAVWLFNGCSPREGDADSPPSTTPTGESAQGAEQLSETPNPVSETNPTPVAEKPTPVAAVFTPVPISYDDLVGGERCAVPGNSGAPWGDVIGPIAGTPYTAGISCVMGRKNASGSLDFLVPQGAKTFTAVAGQTDDSRNVTTVIRFEVLDAVSGAVLASHDLPFGSEGPIDIPVADVLRLTLKASLLTYGIDPYDESVRAAFAVPTFR